MYENTERKSLKRSIWITLLKNFRMKLLKRNLDAAPLTRLEIIFPDGQTETIKTDAKGLFEVNFTSEVKQNDEIILTEKLSDKIVTSSRLETVISINRITKETGATTFTVEKQHPSIHVKEVTYFTKPIAIFMVTPDYDSSNHVIASIFVRQLYYVLSKNASLARGNKCHREVVFLLDEFGVRPYGHIENLLRQEMGVCA